MLVGPAVGGLLVAYVGIGWCFVVDVVGLCVASYLYLRMRPYPHREETTPPSLAGIEEGIVYAFRRRDLLGTYLVDIAAMLLAMPVVLFPALVEEVFERPELLGLLYTAETVGAMVATTLSGWTARVHHHGRAIVIAAAAYGAIIALAGLMPIDLAGRGLPGVRRRRRHDLRDLPLARSGTRPSPRRCAAGSRASRCCRTRSVRSAVRSAPASPPTCGRCAARSSAAASPASRAWTITAAILRDFWTYDDRTDEHADRRARGA